MHKPESILEHGMYKILKYFDMQRLAKFLRSARILRIDDITILLKQRLEKLR